MWHGDRQESNDMDMRKGKAIWLWVLVHCLAITKINTLSVTLSLILATNT